MAFQQLINRSQCNVSAFLNQLKLSIEERKSNHWAADLSHMKWLTSQIFSILCSWTSITDGQVTFQTCCQQWTVLDQSSWHQRPKAPIQDYHQSYGRGSFWAPQRLACGLMKSCPVLAKSFVLIFATLNCQIFYGFFKIYEAPISNTVMILPSGEFSIDMSIQFQF